MHTFRATINAGGVSKTYNLYQVPCAGESINFAWDQLKDTIKHVEWIRLDEVVITLV